MDLHKILNTACMSTGESFADKASALRRISALAAQCGAPPGITEADMLSAFQHREELGSTGFGDGVAIPHCRLAGIDAFIVGIVTCPDGVDFEALDGQPVRLLVFIVAPADQAEMHIRLLSAVSHALRKTEAVQLLLAADSSDALRRQFLGLIQPEAGSGEPTEYILIQVVVQEERLFHDVLQILTAGRTAGTAVIEGHNPASFLARMPLFAEFWNDASEEFCRVVLTVVDGALMNDIIRRIERLTGPLTQRTDILVTAQELKYAAGRLGA